MFKGQFERGSMRNGKIVYSNGDVYEGQFKYGQCHGHGKLERPDGFVYQGQFKRGKYHGQGKFVDAYGDVHEGYFKHGKMHGQGETTGYCWVYTGHYENGLWNGRGKLEYHIGDASGDVYEGLFKDGFGDQGTYTHSNGDAYEGSFRDKLKKGSGRCTYTDGRVYEGEWSNPDGLSWTDAKWDGEGTLTLPSGVSLSGTWSMGQPSGELTKSQSISQKIAQRDYGHHFQTTGGNYGRPMTEGSRKRSRESDEPASSVSKKKTKAD
jgi:hypothetical protein